MLERAGRPRRFVETVAVVDGSGHVMIVEATPAAATVEERRTPVNVPSSDAVVVSRSGPPSAAKPQGTAPPVTPGTPGTKGVGKNHPALGGTASPYAAVPSRDVSATTPTRQL
jgi:hypothetical protein